MYLQKKIRNGNNHYGMTGEESRNKAGCEKKYVNTFNVRPHRLSLYNKRFCYKLEVFQIVFQNTFF